MEAASSLFWLAVGSVAANGNKMVAGPVRAYSVKRGGGGWQYFLNTNPLLAGDTRSLALVKKPRSA